MAGRLHGADAGRRDRLDATTPQQRVLVTTLGELAADAREQASSRRRSS